MSLVTRSYGSSTGPRLQVWKRIACLAVAIALVALPVSVLAEHVDPVTGTLAEHVEGGDPVTGILTAPVVAPVVDPAYTWDPAGQAAMVRDHFLLEHASQ
jgi:hypothetical protein